MDNKEEYALPEDTFYDKLSMKSFKVDDTPNGRSTQRVIFAALCNDLVDYFIVCFEHQCDTMRAV